MELFVPWWAWPLELAHRLVFGRALIVSEDDYEVSYRPALILNEPRKGGGVRVWANPQQKIIQAISEADAEAKFREWGKTEEGQRKLWLAWEILEIKRKP